MTSVTCVLLGVAEVKLPLRRLPQNVRVRTCHVAHKAVLDPDPPEGDLTEEQAERMRAIGVVDGFYALSEVTVQIEDGLCEVKRGQDVVLKHKAHDVIVITPVKDSSGRVVYISRNDSFGRAAVVLQMMSAEQVEKLLSFFPEAVPESLGPTLLSPSNDLSSQVQKDGKSSWSRGMGKKFTSMFASLTTAAGSKKTSPKAVERLILHSPQLELPPEAVTPDKKPATPVADSSSDSEDEIESNSDDTDSQSEGKYYEEMGLDAKVQERLYDDSLETASRTSSSSSESSAYMIECEIRFFTESDADFLKSIQSLEDDRIALTGPDTPQFIRENLTLLFMQVKTLIRLHTDLHGEFEKSGYNITRICEAIIRHQIDYESYVYFMENIPTVDRILQNHVDYFKSNMPELPEKLRKPRMRLHYYVLTLETLHKKCSLSSEKKILQRAMEVLKIPLKKADSKLFLGAVTGSPFDVNDLGNLIRHSDLQLRKGGDLPRRTYHVLVLKTLLIITVSRGRNYQYITSFRMDQVGLGKQERGVMFSLRVRNGPRGSSVLYVFKAKNINVQQQWINVLKEILSDKPQEVTPRTSVIEGESEIKFSGKRSKIRRGVSFDKAAKRLVSPTGNSDKEDFDEDGHKINRSVSDGSAFSGRRAAIRKNNSSISGRHKPVTRQASTNLPSPNRNSIGWKNAEALPPLKVEAIFPLLDRAFDSADDQQELKDNYDSEISVIKDHEDKYVSGLNEQLGTFLDEDFSRPPMCIVAHMRELYTFHESYFSPLLLKACSTYIPREIALCFSENADEFMEIYSNFLADRVRYDAQMQEMDLRNPYVYPVLHFDLYIKSLCRLRRYSTGKGKAFFDEALDMFHQCLQNANTILLTETICGAPFDLDECGPILYQGTIKVRRAGMLMKQELYVVLLNSLILLLEPRIPCYNYVDAVRMDTVGMGPSPDDYTFQLEVRTEATKTVTYSFRTSSKESKRQWEEEITKILSRQVELLKERLKRRLGDDAVNMKQVENEDTDLHKVYPRRMPLLETSL